MAALTPTWNQVLNRAFWFSKFLPEYSENGRKYGLECKKAPQEFVSIMGKDWKGRGYKLPPYYEDGETSIVESLWGEAFLKLYKYHERFGRFPPDEIALELFKDALADISVYAES